MVDRGQRGFALLLVLLVLTTTAAALFFAGSFGRGGVVVEADELGTDLRSGQAGLVLYAALGGVTSGRPATVPCPDMDAPGEPGAGQMTVFYCDNPDEAVVLGRVPWRTLDLEPVAEPLWLAVDQRYVNHSVNEPVNPALADRAGTLELNGIGGHVAVVLAPGMPLAGQAGRPSAERADYLEGHNVAHDADGVATAMFEDCGGRGGESVLADAGACNDRALGLSADRVLEMGGRRALAAVHALLQAYYADQGTLPYAAAGENTPELPCEAGRLAGRLPLTASDGCGAGEYLSVCTMEPWLRPFVADDDDLTAFGCEAATPPGNDWLRFMTYEIDIGEASTCTTPGGPCRVRLAFIDEIGEVAAYATADRLHTLAGYADLAREFVLEAEGGAE